MLHELFLGRHDQRSIDSTQGNNRPNNHATQIQVGDSTILLSLLLHTQVRGCLQSMGNPKQLPQHGGYNNFCIDAGQWHLSSPIISFETMGRGGRLSSCMERCGRERLLSQVRI